MKGKFMNKKFTACMIAGVFAVCIFLGFSINDNPNSSRTPTKNVLIEENNGQTNFSPFAVIKYVDSLNGANDTTALKSRGYKVKRGPTAGPPGTTALWFQGNPAVFPAFNGPTSGYVAANYNATTGLNNIDNWLILPAYDGVSGDTLSFYSQAPTGSTFPDSIRVMYSAIGDTVPTGTWVELGRFKVNTLGIWEKKSFIALTSGSNARFAIRYSVVNAGPSGSNSDFIGIDMITIQGSAPAPVVCTYEYTNQTSGTALTLYSVSAVNDMVAWAAGQASTVRRTTDGGLTWGNGNPTPGTIVGDIYNIYAVDANTAFVTTSPSATFIYKTTNAGATWTQVYTLAGGFINAIEMISPLVGYAEGDPVPVGGPWTILATIDGGNTWTRMPTEPSGAGEAGWNNSFQAMGTNIWFGTNNTRVYRSSDLGLTWSFAATTGTLNTYGVHFNNSMNGVAGGNAGVYTTDGGLTWLTTTVPGAGNITGGIAGGNDNFWVCRGTSMYRSTDNGATWITTAVHTAAGTLWDMDMKVNNCPTGWAVGASGVIARVTGTGVGITNVGSEVPSSYLLKQNFPNPFNPTTNIYFAIPQSGLVTLKVFDITGREISTLVNEVRAAGSYIVDFNASELSSGAYFYRIESGNFVDTKKMMLIK